MKKQELIHLHGLLAEVCEHYEQMAECEVEHTKYTEPVSALADGITEEMEREVEAPVSAAAD
ncbi:metal-binding protein [Halobacteriales archaeon SW_5_68_122]|nr:MAG: metal-binding protein [Halobacteriales archaeon SW_5_68_122]